MRELMTILTVFLLVTPITLALTTIPIYEQGKLHGQAPGHSKVIGITADGDWIIEETIIHYTKPQNPSRLPKTPTCYKLMGVKWARLPVSYVINPRNLDGLEEEFVVNTIVASAETWDSVTSSELFNNQYTVNYDLSYGVYDQKNVIDFGYGLDSNVIAVTTVWYTMRGKQIIEFDMRFNDAFTWGDATSNPVVMDLQNIATHELGHSVGMDDVYTDSCSAVTMYGFGTEGETQKRTLEQPDITGLQKLYGV